MYCVLDFGFVGIHETRCLAHSEQENFRRTARARGRYWSTWQVSRSNSTAATCTYRVRWHCNTRTLSYFLIFCSCLHTKPSDLDPCRRTAPDGQGSHPSQRHEDALMKKVRTLERKLVKEQRETMRVRATRARDAVERSEMEDFFLQCVEVRVAPPRANLGMLQDQTADVVCTPPISMRSGQICDISTFMPHILHRLPTHGRVVPCRLSSIATNSSHRAGREARNRTQKNTATIASICHFTR